MEQVAADYEKLLELQEKRTARARMPSTKPTRGGTSSVEKIGAFPFCTGVETPCSFCVTVKSPMYDSPDCAPLFCDVFRSLLGADF
jgi:hypothetical protein